MHRVSIIICTHNRADRLKSTLDALDAVLPTDSPNVEIVLVDNASRDNTPQVMAEFASHRAGVKCVIEPRPGKSLALNKGAQESTGDILIWLDDDVVPQPGWLDALVRPIYEDKADVVVGRITLAPSLLRDWFTPELRERVGEVPSLNGGTYPVGGNTAVTRALYDRIGGHDPNIGPGVPDLCNGEDTLFSHQMVALGARLGYAEGGWVEHHFDESRLLRKSWIEIAESQGRSQAYIFYHWEHESISWPWLKSFRKKIELAVWRMKHAGGLDPNREGANVEEIRLVNRIGFLHQYWIESHKPHNYDKRGVKRRNAAPTASDRL